MRRLTCFLKRRVGSHHMLYFTLSDEHYGSAFSPLTWKNKSEVE
jgi:hypothetical protein